MNKLHPAFVHPAYDPNLTVVAQGPSLRGNPSTESSETSHARFAPANFLQGFQAIYSRPFFGFTPSLLSPHQAKPISTTLTPRASLGTEIVSSDGSSELPKDTSTTTKEASPQEQIVVPSAQHSAPQVIYTRAAIPFNALQMGARYFINSLPFYARIFNQVFNSHGSTAQNLFQNVIIPLASHQLQQAQQANDDRPNHFYLPPSSSSSYNTIPQQITYPQNYPTAYTSNSQGYPNSYQPNFYAGQPYPQSYPTPYSSYSGFPTPPSTVSNHPMPLGITSGHSYASPSYSSSVPTTNSFGKSQIRHGATLNDFYPKEDPPKPREQGAYFAAVVEEYKKYSGYSDLKNCAEDAMNFGGRFLHPILGIKQKNVSILSEYLDNKANLPTFDNYDAMIDSAIQYANQHGFAVISFSGHGVNIPANSDFIKNQINPTNLAHIPLESYQCKKKVSCQLTLDGKFYSDRRLLSKLMNLNENAFLLMMFDNCHNDFDFPRCLTGKGEMINKPALNSAIKGCVTFLGSCKLEETSSDGLPTIDFPAGSGAATAAYTSVFKDASQQGIDKLSFRELVNRAQSKIQGTQTLVVASSHLFEPDDLIPLTPEGAKAFMEKHRAVTV